MICALDKHFGICIVSPSFYRGGGSLFIKLRVSQFVPLLHHKMGIFPEKCLL